MSTALQGIGTGTEDPGASGWILAGAVSLSLHMLLIASVALDLRGRPSTAAPPRTEMILNTPPTVAGGEIALRRVDAGAASDRQGDDAERDRLAAEEAELGQRADDAERLGAETPETLAAENAERLNAETPEALAAAEAERVRAQTPEAATEPEPVRAEAVQSQKPEAVAAAAPQRLRALPEAQPLRARPSSPATIRAEPAPPRPTRPARIQAETVRPQPTRPAAVQAARPVAAQATPQKAERLASQTTRPARIRAEGSAPNEISRPSSAPVAGTAPLSGQQARAERTVQNTDEEEDPAVLARRTGADARLSDRVAAPSNSAAARAVQAQRAAAAEAAAKAAAEAAARAAEAEAEQNRNRARYDALVAQLRALPRSPCFLALPAMGPDGDLRLEVFGPDQATLDSFGNTVQAAVGEIPEMAMHAVDASQCDVLDFARASPAWPETGLYFSLTRRQVVSGTQLEGEVHNGDDKILHLLMIDSYGRVVRLDPFLRWSRGRTLFEVPIQAQPGGAAAWQLLMTLASKGPLQSVQALPPGRAVSVEQFFGVLAQEIRSIGAMPDLSVIAFSLN